MRNGRNDFSQIGGGESGFVHARGLDLRPDLPLSTDKLVGVDLTHIIHTSEVAAARGGGGGGHGGGGGTTFTLTPQGPRTGRPATTSRSSSRAPGRSSCMTCSSTPPNGWST